MSRINPKYVVLVETDNYAGNYECELTAYCVGERGDRGVGDEAIELFKKDNVDCDFSNVICVSINSEYEGLYVPCNNCLNDNGECNTVAIYFDSQPTEKQIQVIKERSENFIKPDIYRACDHCVFEETFERYRPKKILSIKVIKFNKKFLERI